MSFYRKMKRKPWKFIHVIALIAMVELLIPQVVSAASPAEPITFDTRSPLLTVDHSRQALPSVSDGDTVLVERPTLPTVPDRPIVKRIKVTVTAYNSLPEQTSGNPFVTASGARTGDGVIAYNHLPFGTKVRFPEQFGTKVFTVLDRLPAKNGGPYHVDMWMAEKSEALQWGVRVITMEVIE